ncbi:MAG: hypothetical protein KGJ55_02010 [Gammaproteobacteria bacterium]|nr:hypothetical protein [Gammaproteobacteria bacterium]
MFGSLIFALARVWLAPFLVLVRHRATPELSRLGLDPIKPLCYVLPTCGWIDALALARVCRKLGLPAPQRSGAQLPGPRRAVCLYLPALRQPDAGLGTLLNRAAAAAGYEVQVLPLSLRALAEVDGNPLRAQRKAARVLQLQFLRARTAALGPTLLRRAVVIAGVPEVPAVRHAIEREAAAKGLPLKAG